VLLDAGASADPEDDAMVIAWTCKDQRLGCEQQGAKLTFVAASVGTVEVDLKVSKLIDPSQSQGQTVTIEVIASPKVTVDESRILKMEGQTTIALEGTCASCTEWNGSRSPGQ